MQVTMHDVFVAMYYALEAATDKYDDQKLRTFIQDCDPFVWKDRLSADPAVYAEFSEAYTVAFGDGFVSAEEARVFCRAWLKKQAAAQEFYAGPLVTAFDSIATTRDWASALTEL